MPEKSNIPKDPIEEMRRGFRALYNHRGPPAAMMVSGMAWDDLVSRSHDCLLHRELPVVVVDTYEDDEWAYRTPPARLEISCAIWEEMRAWKGPISQHDLERLLGSTRKRTCPALTQGERDTTRHADQLKGITD